MSQQRISIQDTAAPPPTMTALADAAEASRTTPALTEQAPGTADRRIARRPKRVVVAVSMIGGLTAAGCRGRRVRGRDPPGRRPLSSGLPQSLADC